MALCEDELERKLIGSKGLWKVLAANTFKFAVGNAVTGYHQRALAGEHIGETSGPCEQQVHFTLRQTESQFRPFQVFSYRLDGSNHNHIVAPKSLMGQGKIQMQLIWGYGYLFLSLDKP